MDRYITSDEGVFDPIPFGVVKREAQEVIANNLRLYGIRTPIREAIRDYAIPDLTGPRGSYYRDDDRIAQADAYWRRVSA